MGLAGFLRKLQDIHTKHKLKSTIFFGLLVIPCTFFYSLYATTHLSNVFINKINEDANNNFVGATIDYISFIAQIEGFAVLGISMFSLLAPILHILASERKIDPEAKLSIKNLILTVTKHARSLIIMWFFVRVFKLGFIFLGMLILLQNQHLMFINNSICDKQHELSSLIASNIGTTIVLTGGVLIFAYLASFGNLAIDISVREGVSGTNALEKDSQILEGKRKILGFVMNVVFGVISLGLFVGYVYLNTCSKLSVDMKKSIIIVWNNVLYQFENYTWAFFSMLHFMCRNSGGEEIITLQPHAIFKRVMLEEQPLLAIGIICVFIVN